MPRKTTPKKPEPKEFLRGEHVDAYLKTVNELLDGAPVMGAYCMGLSCALIFSNDPQDYPTRALLEKLRACTSVQQGSRLMWLWLNGSRV